MWILNSTHACSSIYGTFESLINFKTSLNYKEKKDAFIRIPHSSRMLFFWNLIMDAEI